MAVRNHINSLLQTNNFDQSERSTKNSKTKPPPTLTHLIHLQPLIRNSCRLAQKILGSPLKHWDDPTFQHEPFNTISVLTWNLCRPPRQYSHETLQEWYTKQRKILRKIRNRILDTHQRTTIAQQNYFHTSNQIGNLCKLTNPPNRDPPLPEIYSLTPPESYGDKPLRPRAITLYEQLQATADVHNKQMHPPPGKALFFADIKSDNAGTSGITLHPDRTFTKDDLESYSPGCTKHMSHRQLERIIKAHANVAHLFKTPEPKDVLK